MKNKNCFFKILLSYFLLFIILFSINCSKKTSTNDLTKVKVGMMFIPNVQFAPFYVALDNGYYAEAKLDVTFDFSNPMDAIQFVGIGKFDFVIGDGEQVIIARDKGLPIRYVLSIYSKYPVGIASLPETGINRPLDLIGKTIGVPDYYGASYIGLKAFLNKTNITESETDIITIGFTQAASLNRGRVDAAVVYLNNTPVQIRSAKQEINLIPLHQYVSLVSAGVITNDNMTENYPDLVKKFVQGTLKGLNFVKNNPAQALEICFKYIKEGADSREIQYEVLKESIKLYENDYTRIHGLGFSDSTTWENSQTVLFNLKLVKQKQDVDFFYTNRYLEK